MSSSAIEYVRTQLATHARLFFRAPAAELLTSDKVRFASYNDASAMREPIVVIPTDIPVPSAPSPPWRIPFNETTVTLWNPTPRPVGDGWRCLPDNEKPAWYRHSSGLLMPAWNMFGNVFDLLTFGEEQRCSRRDQHGRFASKDSPRSEKGLLEVPTVNEAVALLVDALTSVNSSSAPSFTAHNLVKQPTIVLSHDCDTLAGNEPWTQLMRLYRFLEPLPKLRPPKLDNLWWIARNALSPHRFFLDNATGMVDLERCFGHVSTFYLLNGDRGRLGARSRFSDTLNLIEHIPSSWDIGIHYNYDTHLDKHRFSSQLSQLQQKVPEKIVCGRAHYLRFDPMRSFPFLSRFGIYADESSGWPDCVGYRNGIAGCFQAYDVKRKAPLNIWEVPLAAMDIALIAQHGAEAVAVAEKHIGHLSKIGGAYTVLMHPGNFFNPDHPSLRSLYHELLQVFRHHGAVSRTTRQLVDQARSL